MTEDAHPLVRVDLPARGRTADGEPGDALPGVALMTIERREALNALSGAVLAEIAAACRRLDADPDCRAIVITGSGSRAFASGADIREMAGETAEGLQASGRFDDWDALAWVRVPTIAAVRGFALGGGLELAMSCDMLIVGDDARFGQPEVKLGIMPGAGGTQRLTRAVGKARAMELILTGRTFDAHEAAAMGLVTRVVPATEALSAALGLAATIAGMPPLAVRSAKQAVVRADELPLADGLRHERGLFYALFATEDRREGMAAFLEKRPPSWKGR